ncbi:MAG: PilT/PilU family type 4a pilus ATPase [Verrucomicrobia subdivision 3 bacterium]|nr:PilT/PilU family type 4a pilus ATPase [Limisphaerales bacterium]
MTLDSLIGAAQEEHASDLHLEPGLPPALRVRGALRTFGEPVAAKLLLDFARELIGPDQWPTFLQRRSFDTSRTIHGIRCRINVLQTSRGVGFAVRLLAAFQATFEKLNLLPDLRRFLTHPNGLIIVSGATGSGKSSTLAAMIQEVNVTEARHIVTIESPIEYVYRPRLAYIRQREVGRDTPSYEQGLIDALREDPDVLMVGEMREPETMRLTLNAAETGHLVLTTLHSASCSEALARVVSAFPAEMQNSVRAQLADCIIAIICQRLRFRPDLKIRVPECEIMVNTHAVKNYIRTGDFFKIMHAMEIGAESGMWTFARYQGWLENKKTCYFPAPDDKPESEPAAEPTVGHAIPGAPLPAAPHAPPAATPRDSKRIEIEPVEGGLDALIKKLGNEETA